jgi:hypothetical protein
MKADLSRHTFDPARHYSSVRLQQGRVQLDADFNEQADIVEHRTESEALDVIGRCGGPLHGAGFAITIDLTLPNGDFRIGAGGYYVDGILCENEQSVRYTAQPDRRGVTPVGVSTAGFHVVYLDVWQRHVTALDDPRLRETALGGPDTATRAHTTWQVRTVPAGAGPVDCGTTVAAYTAATAASTGALRARAVPAAPTSGPCIVPAAADYQGLENQLYRVEVHDGGAPYDLAAGGNDAAINGLPTPEQVVYAGGTWNVGDAVEVFRSAANSDPMVGYLAYVTANDAATKTLTLNAVLPALSLTEQPRIRHVAATYKWSRDNGSVAALVKTVAGADVVVDHLEPDDVRSFAPGQWVELSDDARELEGVPGQLAQIAAISVATNTITLRAAPTFPGNVAVADAARHLKIRRWDGAGAVKVGASAPSEGYAALEDGVEVRLDPGTYRTGDFWLIAARTATADALSGRIEWPAAGGGPAALPAFGITHHYCRIAILESDGTTVKAHDCRPLFPPLTDPALVYVGGDGQEAMPGETLPQLLEAGVFRGTVPVEGATVRFHTAAAAGRLAADVASAPTGGATFEKTTGADGIARAGWRPDPAGPVSQQATAQLLDPAATPLGPPIDFNGSLSVADHVAYDPSGDCPDLKSAGTVQEAIDILCRRPTGVGCSVVVTPDQRLDKVVKQLLDEGRVELCLCLTAGDHELPNGLVLTSREVSLELCGCEGGTRVKVGEGIMLSELRSVTIADIDLTLASDGPFVFDHCATVQILSCDVRREVPGEVACAIIRADRIRLVDDLFSGYVPRGGRPVAPIAKLLEIADRRRLLLQTAALADELAGDEGRRAELGDLIAKAAARIAKLSGSEQVAYAVLAELLRTPAPAALGLRAGLMGIVDAVAATDAGPALTIDDGGAEAEIAECRLIGDLGLYGTPGDAVLGGDEAGRLGQLRNQGALRLQSAGGNLHLRENALTRIALGDELTKLLATPADKIEVPAVFRAATLSDNVVPRPGNALIAGHVVLNANDFPQSADDVGVVVADSAIYTANHAPNDIRLFSVAQAATVAANLTINIVNV